MPNGATLTTVTLCRYPPRERFWAFNRMGSARREFARVPGLRFRKLLGTGQGRGFSLRPDFSCYGMLAVWESAIAADEFFSHSALMSSYREHASEVWTIRMLSVMSHGRWSQCDPFQPVSDVLSEGRPVAVLTRATIRMRKLSAFWRSVPATSHALDDADGLIFSIGTGELPFIRPATFSIWESEESVRAFAYGNAEHRDVIRRRRDESWYAEELFARFLPIASEGTWNGIDLSERLLHHDRIGADGMLNDALASGR